MKIVSWGEVFNDIWKKLLKEKGAGSKDLSKSVIMETILKFLNKEGADCWHFVCLIEDENLKHGYAFLLDKRADKIQYGYTFLNDKIKEKITVVRKAGKIITNGMIEDPIKKLNIVGSMYLPILRYENKLTKPMYLTKLDSIVEDDNYSKYFQETGKRAQIAGKETKTYKTWLDNLDIVKEKL